MKTTRKIVKVKSNIKFYFKRNWNESRGDNYDHWGTSVWYFETRDNGEVTRQVEVYKNGKVNKYCETHVEDEYGGLSIYPLDLEEFENHKITKTEFEHEWQKVENILNDNTKT